MKKCVCLFLSLILLCILATPACAYDYGRPALILGVKWLDSGSVVKLGGGLTATVKEYTENKTSNGAKINVTRILFPVLSGYEDKAFETRINATIKDFFFEGTLENRFGDLFIEQAGGILSISYLQKFGHLGLVFTLSVKTLNISLETGRIYDRTALLRQSFWDMFDALYPSQNDRASSLALVGFHEDTDCHLQYNVTPAGIYTYKEHISGESYDLNLYRYTYDEIDDYLDKNGEMWWVINHGSPERAAMESLPFSDLTRNHWSYTYVRDAYDAGLMKGTGTGYDPDAALTSEQAAAIMSRLLGLEPDAGLTPYPENVSGSWYEDKLNAAYQAGLLDGTVNFTIGQPFQRQDLMILLANAIDLTGIDAETAQHDDLLMEFSDSGLLTDAGRAAAAKCISAGFISGDNGNLNPDHALTRAQLSKILAMILAIR